MNNPPAGFHGTKQNLPFHDNDDNSLSEWLMTIKDVKCRKINGTDEYYVSQDTANKRKITSPRVEDNTPAAKQCKTKVETKEIKTFPSIYDFELVGDAQFLNIALFELDYPKEPDQRRQCGNCVSGLRIREATQLIKDMKNRSDKSVKRIVVNVGSVDIAEGRMLIEMIRDMEHFVNVCNETSVIPIITTLPPLPNYTIGRANSFKMENLNGFNHFIRVHLSKKCAVIDLHRSMLRNGSTDNGLYQVKHRYLSGSRKPFLMWNKMGRKRILNMLRKNLGHALVYQRNFVGVFV